MKKQLIIVIYRNVNFIKLQKKITHLSVKLIHEPFNLDVNSLPVNYDSDRCLMSLLSELFTNIIALPPHESTFSKTTPLFVQNYAPSLYYTILNYKVRVGTVQPFLSKREGTAKGELVNPTNAAGGYMRQIKMKLICDII